MFKFLKRRKAAPPPTAATVPAPPPPSQPRRVHRAEADGPNDDSTELRRAGQARTGRGRHAGLPGSGDALGRPERDYYLGGLYDGPPPYGSGLLSGYDVPGGPGDRDADGVPDRFEGGPLAGTDSSSTWTAPDPAPSAPAPDPAPAPDTSSGSGYDGSTGSFDSGSY